MKEEIKSLETAGSDGFVIGCLRRDSNGLLKVCQRDATSLVNSSQKPFTFHRAFDVSMGPIEDELKAISISGCSYLLTSGRASIGKDKGLAFVMGSIKNIYNSENKTQISPIIENICQLSTQCRKLNIKLMIGGGVTEQNAKSILDLGVDFIHGSFSTKTIFQNAIFHLGTVHQSQADTIARVVSICKNDNN